MRDKTTPENKAGTGRTAQVTDPEVPEGGLPLPGTLARSVFVTATSLLLVVGTVMVFSAGAFSRPADGDPHFFLERQLVWLALALVGCWVFSRLPSDLLRRHHWKLLVASTVLLGLVLVPGVGREVNAARRWIRLGGGLQFQPSEFAKLAVIIFVAGFMAAAPERRRQFFRGFLVVCAAVLPVFLLILVEPDFGTAVFILGMAFFLLLLSGIRKAYLLGSTVIFAPIIALFVTTYWEKVQRRLLGFLDPESSYQVHQSLTALGAGGWSGVGLGSSGQKLRFLPEAHTDFIFSILGEELGFVGCLLTLILLVLLLWGGVGMVWRTRDLFRFLVGAGIIMSLSFQAVVNIAVVTGSAPTKGIPLPLITFGGSGLCVTLAQIGLLLALDRENRREALEARRAAARVDPGAVGDLPGEEAP
jgi:cell division protein FtsW